MRYRCEATISWRWSDTNDYDRCQNTASVEIDGVKMCLCHAGTVAVRKLIQLNEATKLETVGPYYNKQLCKLDAF